MTGARRTNFVAYAPSNCLEEHHKAIQRAEQEREQARQRDLQAKIRMTGPQDDSETADQARDFLGEPFRLHSIVEVPAPEGIEGVWQQYVIVQGINTINGLRPGTRSEVSVQIESMVEHLNERFRKGKARLVDSPGRKPPPPRIGRPTNRGSKPLPLQSEFQEKVEVQ